MGKSESQSKYSLQKELIKGGLYLGVGAWIAFNLMNFLTGVAVFVVMQFVSYR
jgi:hypothetical protein